MWKNLKFLADVGATVGGVIFLWNVALGFAEEKVRAEYLQQERKTSKKSSNTYDMDDISVTRDGDTIKIKFNKK